MKIFNIIFSSQRELCKRIFGKCYGDYSLFNTAFLTAFFFPIGYQMMDYNREIGFIILFVSFILVILNTFTYNEHRKEVEKYSTKKLVLICLSYGIVSLTPFVWMGIANTK